MITNKQQQKIDKLLSIYRDKIDNYIEQNDYKFSQEYFIQCVVASDPDEQGKSVKWILNNVLNGNILWEDVESGDESKVYDTLNRFYSIRQQFADQSLRDINQFKRLGDITEQLRGFEVIQSNKEIKRDKKEQIYKDTIFLYNQNGYLVVVPKTQEASCFWGLNTEWCTAATRSQNMFNHYNEKGPLYICITPDGKKYQFHKNSKPMNQNDNPMKKISKPILKELALITGRIDSVKNLDLNKIKNNYNLLKLIIESNPQSTFDLFNANNLIDIEFIKSACKIAKETKNNKFLIKIFEYNNFRKNKDFYDEIVKVAPEIIFYLNEYNKDWVTLKDYENLCKNNVNSVLYSSLFADIRKFNKDEYIKLCKVMIQNTKESSILNYIDKDCIDEEMYYLYLNNKNINNIYKTFNNEISKSLLTQELADLIIKTNPNNILYINYDYLNNDNITQAILADSNLLHKIKSYLLNDEIINNAIKENPKIYTNIPDVLKNKENTELAISLDNNNYYYTPEHLLTKDFCNKILDKYDNILLGKTPLIFIKDDKFDIYCERLNKLVNDNSIENNNLFNFNEIKQHINESALSLINYYYYYSIKKNNKLINDDVYDLLNKCPYLINHFSVIINMSSSCNNVKKINHEDIFYDLINNGFFSQENKNMNSNIIYQSIIENRDLFYKNKEISKKFIIDISNSDENTSLNDCLIKIKDKFLKEEYLQNSNLRHNINCIINGLTYLTKIIDNVDFRKQLYDIDNHVEELQESNNNIKNEEFWDIKYIKNEIIPILDDVEIQQKKIVKQTELSI